jgi:cytosine/adenosine deaminase-related metal-dependent hydrolase
VHASAFADTHAGSTRLGLQPHAPYSVDPAGFAHAVALAERIGEKALLSTHLAETHDERIFVEHARGPHRAMLESLGLWQGPESAGVGNGLRPIRHLERPLAARPGRWLAAHVADAADNEIDLLARLGVSVAYCPRSSAYFRTDTDLGPHRYRDMLAAGINVCLGTDSIVNLDTPGRITPLDDARLLYQRDQTDPVLLVAMATVHGAAAIGLDTSLFALKEGRKTAGIVLLPIGESTRDDAGGDPLAAALRIDTPTEPLVLLAATQGGPAGRV